jgi:uncharacterized protein (TIGR02266 family)
MTRQSAGMARSNQERSSRPERRSFARARIVTSVHLASDSNFFAGLSNDISEGGIFVATYSLLRPGTLADLEFTLPDGGEPIRVQGEVRWLREPQVDRTIMPGMGFRFVNLSESDRLRVERFVSQRETILYED